MRGEETEVREIHVLGIEFWGRHGVFDEERMEGRRFQVDVRAWVDAWPCGDADQLQDTLDYRQLAQAVVDVGQGVSVRLIETIADRIVGRCLTLPSVTRVEVAVRKRATGVPGTPTWVGVRLVRSAAPRTPSPSEAGSAILTALAAEGVPVLADDAIADLRELQIEGDEDVVAQLVTAYLQDLPERLDTIRTAVRDRSAASLEITAHALKAASGSIGVLRLSRLCQALEHAAASRNLDRTPALLEALNAAWAEAEAALRPLAPDAD